MGRGKRRGAGLGLPLLLLIGCSEGGCPAVDSPVPDAAHEALLEPGSAEFQAVPPDTFFVRFETTKGPLAVEIVREWAPLGAARFYNLVRGGFYDGASLFRVVPGFVVQFGASRYAAVQRAWDARAIEDDSVRVSNERGTITFAAAGKDTRTTQVFINYNDNPQLDELGFAPIGRVVRGMGAALAFYSGYGDLPPGGNAPSYGCMLEGGDAYLRKRYPQLDRIESARIVDRAAAMAG